MTDEDLRELLAAIASFDLEIQTSSDALRVLQSEGFLTEEGHLAEWYAP